MLAIYILLTEPSTKLLVKKELKPVDIGHIVAWTKIKFRNEEFPPKTRVLFWGEGVADEWVTGWTIQTKRYTKDYTRNIENLRPLIIGRENEFDALCIALSKKVNNNVLLVGELGVGKESLIQAFAYDSYNNCLNNELNHKKVLELLVGALLAGVSDKGILEARLQAIISEVSHAENITLFIPEFQNVLGVTATGVDVSGVLPPYLQDGHMPVIATMSPGNYKNFLEENPLHEVFDIIHIPEADRDIAIRMLIEKVDDIERETKTNISYLAITAAVDFSKKYSPDDYLPGSAVKLLIDTAYKIGKEKGKGATITVEDVFNQIENKTHVKVGIPTNLEKDILLHLEEILHKRIIGQDEAIKAISEGLRRVRANLSDKGRPTTFLFLGPTGVGKTETAKALADTYFGGEESIVRLDMSEYADKNSIERLIGSVAVGVNMRGVLTEKVHDNPFTLVLLDEFEKASEEVQNLFLQVFEDARLTDSRGRTISFASSIIIATSNAGSEYIREEIVKGSIINKKFQAGLLGLLESKGIFKPELLNRFDAIVAFTPLSQDEQYSVVKLLLQEVVNKLKEQDITVVFDKSIVEKVIKDGFNEEFGARTLRRYIQDSIEDVIAKKLLIGAIKRGNSIVLFVNEQGNIVFK